MYEDGLQAIPSAHMFELYARFLLDILDMDSTDLDSSTSPDSSVKNKTNRHDIADELIELYNRALVAGFVSEALVKGHLEILLRSGMVDEAAELGRNFCERLDTKKFASVWEWRISLELGQISLSFSNVDSMLAISKLFQQALTCVPLSDARRLYLMVSQLKLPPSQVTSQKIFYKISGVVFLESLALCGFKIITEFNLFSWAGHGVLYWSGEPL